MNEKEFRELITDKQWKDEWWVAVDGAVLDGRLSLKEAVSIKQQMPSRVVALMHPRSVETNGVDWKNLDLTVAAKSPASARKTASTGSARAPQMPSTNREVQDMRNQIRNINDDLNDIKTSYQQVSEVIIEGFTDLARRMDAQTEQMEQLKLMFGQMIDLKKFKQQLDERQKALKQKELRKDIEAEQQQKPSLEDKPRRPQKSALDLDSEKKPLPPNLSLPGRVVGKGSRPEGADAANVPPPPPRRS
jgi:hypothetical protein